MFRKKSLSDELFLHFVCKSSESDRFSIIYMIRIRFFRPRELNQKGFRAARYWSDDVWKSTLAGGGGNKKRFQYCTDPSGQEILYLRALQGHSGRNPIDPSPQDNVLIPNSFFEYIYHIGCAAI